MTINPKSKEELELLAAGYVLDDLDPEERDLVDKLIRTNSAMREEIARSIQVTVILASNVPEKTPSASLKDKIVRSFSKQNNEVKVKSSKAIVVNLGNWFQQKFTAGWRSTSELSIASAAPAFRNSSVSGSKKIAIGKEETTIILIIKVAETTLSERDVILEILPESGK